MKSTIKVKKKVEVKFLVVSAGVRYWEDSEVNGTTDDDGLLIPCRKGDYWCPVIDVDAGKIINWTQGVTAYVHYKVCDDGTYVLQDKDGAPLIERDGYVPDCMCPKEKGYGDYIIMKIDEEGNIEGWNPDFSDFNN